MNEKSAYARGLGRVWYKLVRTKMVSSAHVVVFCAMGILLLTFQATRLQYGRTTTDSALLVVHEIQVSDVMVLDSNKDIIPNDSGTESGESGYARAIRKVEDTDSPPRDPEHNVTSSRIMSTFRTLVSRGKSKPNCPESTNELNLMGEINLNLTLPSMSDLEARHPELDPGGHWRPSDCTANHNVAIVVPYRDRLQQLLLLLQHLHPFLQKQKMEYTIYLLEQAPGRVFNRGLGRNIGFLEARKLDPSHQCTVFHDVDLLPIDERNLYMCPEQPRHLCTAVNYIEDYRPLYADGWAYFGGVTSLRNEHFRLVNGYSNIYIGWGAEDDDMYKRIKKKNLEVFRYPDHISGYYGVPHQDESLLPRPVSLAQGVSRFKLLNVAAMRMRKDGLNTTDYHVIKITKQRLYTHILFDVEEDKYAHQALHYSQLYDELYGSLPKYWNDLNYIPPPYWWLNSTFLARVNARRKWTS